MWDQPVDGVVSPLPPVLRGSQVEQQRRPLLKGEFSRTSAHVVKFRYGLDLLRFCITSVKEKMLRYRLFRDHEQPPTAQVLAFVTRVGSVVYLIQSSWLTVGAFTEWRNAESGETQRKLYLTDILAGFSTFLPVLFPTSHALFINGAFQLTLGGKNQLMVDDDRLDDLVNVGLAGHGVLLIRYGHQRGAEANG